MKLETLKALKQSIAKYRKAAKESARKLSTRIFNAEECPLCELHYAVKAECSGCPVAEAGHSGCKRTPWSKSSTEPPKEIYNACLAGLVSSLEYEIKYGDNPKLIKVLAAHIRERCAQEADFLESLLPKSL